MSQLTHNPLRTSLYLLLLALFATALTTQLRAQEPDSCKYDSSRYFNAYTFEILPQDTVLEIGEQVQFRAFLIDTNDIRTDTTATWELMGRQVGTISEGGLFTASEGGIGHIKAKLPPYTATTGIIIIDPADTSRCDSVRIRLRDRDGKFLGHIHRMSEKDIYRISGLPFPFTILNGGSIFFPPGSISEDITVDISLPETAIIHGDTSVSFIDEILTGISFNVYVDSVLVSPYYFDLPIQIILPYKTGAMHNLGLVPENLWVFFYSDSAGYDTTGIYNVMVDSSAHKIYVELIHFTDVVVASRAKLTPTSVEGTAYVPAVFRLYDNYPNPFNPETVIRFDVPEEFYGEITLSVYNMLGQKIRTLLRDTLHTGSYTVRWDGTDEAGRLLGSGVYLYRLSGHHITITRKMMFLR